MKPLSERIKTFSTSQFVDWLCLACVDVREVRTPVDAQEEINKIREALTERLSTLQEQLTATTNSLTNAQEALKSAWIEADTVQAGVVELVSRMNQVVAQYHQLRTYALSNLVPADHNSDDELPAFEHCDAYLNALRAEGADAASAKIRKAIPAFKDIHCGAVKECADIAEMVAAQFTAGNAGKDGV